MKKLLLLMILALSIFMCSVEKEDKKAGKSTDGVPKKIVIGLDDSFVPMGFKDEKGEIVGFDIDLAKAVAQKLGSEVEFKPINWDSKILDLNGGNIDLIWNGLTITEERKKETEMTKPYFTSHQLIVVKAGSSINTKADLTGKNIGSQTESSGEEAVKKSGDDKKFKEFKTYAQYDQAFMDLDAGRVDAIIADEVLAKYTKKTKETQAKKELYKILNDNYGEEEYGIAARRGNFIDADGKILGEHRGIVHYTIGQRKGLGIAFGKPMFVKEIRPESNEVVLSDNEGLFTTRVLAEKINFMAETREEIEVSHKVYMAKIRYNHKGGKCTLSFEGENIVAEFLEPQRASAPGQTLVVYNEAGEVVCGGRIIRS